MSRGLFVRAPHHDLHHARPLPPARSPSPATPAPSGDPVHEFYRSLCASQTEPKRKRQRTAQPDIREHRRQSGPAAAPAPAHACPAEAAPQGHSGAGPASFCSVCREPVATTMAEHVASIAHLFRAQDAPQPLVSYSVGSSNPGWRLLEQQGWTPHTGLGRSGTGMLAPLATRFRSNRQGLGVAHLSAKQRTHTAAHIAEVKRKEEAAARQEPFPKALTRRQQLRAQEQDRHKDRVLRELLHTDHWEYLHPGEPLPTATSLWTLAGL
eukprot:EG_transcript_23273